MAWINDVVEAFFSPRCPACRGKLNKGARFCPDCGAAAADLYKACPGCRTPLPVAAAYCSSCAAEQPHPQVPDAESLTDWVRRPGSFAEQKRVALATLVREELLIAEGTRAVVSIDGQRQTELAPGRHTLSSLPDEVLGGVPERQQASVAFLDAGDVLLRYVDDDGCLQPVYTSDPIGLKVQLEVVARLASPTDFCANVLKDAPRYGVEQLRDDLLRGEVINALSEELRRVSARQLDTDRTTKEGIERGLRDHLRNTLRRTGLEIVGVRALSFVHPHLDRVTKKREDFVLEAMTREAGLERHKRLFEVFNDTQIQKTAEIEAQAANQHRRTAAVLDLRRGLHDLEAGKLSDADALAKLRRGARAAEILGEAELETLAREVEQKERTATDAFRRALDLAEAEHRRAQQLAEARHDDSVAQQKVEGALGRRQKVRDAEHGERVRRTDREHEEARRGADMEQDVKDREANRDVDVLERMTRMRRELDESRADKELEREKALHAARAHELEIKSGMTEAQLLALVSDRSPDAARALQAKFEATDARERENLRAELNEKVLEAQREAHRDSTATQQRALEQMKEVAVSFAQAFSGAQDQARQATERSADRVEGMGGRTVDAMAHAAAGTAHAACSGCGHVNEGRARFCEQCGTSL